MLLTLLVVAVVIIIGYIISKATGKNFNDVTGLMFGNKAGKPRFRGQHRG